jgi:hypothetical protein
MPPPKLLAMLIKQDLEGDDALLRLGQIRFQEAGLGAEIYPVTPEQLTEQLAFCPTDRPCTAHLPRNLNLLLPEARDRILEFAARAAGRLYGVLVHDDWQFGDRREQVSLAFRDLDRRLTAVPDGPLLFVEYAAGLPPDVFAGFFEKTVELRRVCACIDISHVGIQVCKTAYTRDFPGIDLFSLKNSPELSRHIDDVQKSVAEALPAVVGLVKRLARLGKPLHFHLHDGHPLSTLSRYGVSDHLSFLQELHLPCAYRGRQMVGGMFGPAGLREIVGATLAGLAPERVSFMIEVHRQEGRVPLGTYRSLLAHWKDMTNGERMNYWLEVLIQNAVLLREACSQVPTASGSAAGAR